MRKRLQRWDSQEVAADEEVAYDYGGVAVSNDS